MPILFIMNLSFARTTSLSYQIKKTREENNNFSEIIVVIFMFFLLKKILKNHFFKFLTAHIHICKIMHYIILHFLPQDDLEITKLI